MAARQPQHPGPFMAARSIMSSCVYTLAHTQNVRAGGGRARLAVQR